MRKNFRKFLFLLLFLFIGMNIIAAYHAYRFTHFTSSVKTRTQNPEQLSFFHKISVLISGVENPRPTNDSLPQKPYQTLNLKGHDGRLSCWLIPKKNAKGTVILFHGYGADKSKLVVPASVFDSLGYQTLLVDFMGCGSSEGNRTTIGYYEADEVSAAFLYAKNIDSNILVFGSSMGASAILRAIYVYQIHPSKIILECPYGSMVYATKNRFSIIGVPSFPMAYLLDFWGGVENGYWAFS